MDHLDFNGYDALRFFRSARRSLGCCEMNIDPVQNLAAVCYRSLNDIEPRDAAFKVSGQFSLVGCRQSRAFSDPLSRAALCGGNSGFLKVVRSRA